MSVEGWDPYTLKPVPLQMALKLIADSLTNVPLRSEVVEVTYSVRRVSAEDVLAPCDLPPRDKAALDGIAVRSSDVNGASFNTPVRLRLEPPNAQRDGARARLVATGDDMPEWADAVVKREDVRFVDGYAEVYESIEPGKNVFKRGDDIKRGERVLRKGELIRPVHVALLEGLGIETVKVYCKPKVAIVAVGDELYEGYRERGVKAINYAHLASMMVARLGCAVERVTASPDNVDALAIVISEIVEKCDVILTVGGSSIGYNDKVSKAIESIPGAKVLFHGLLYNPAKTSGYAIVRGKPLLMLPGQVTSMMGAFFLLGEQLLSALMGLESVKRVTVNAVCTSTQGLKRGVGNLILVKLRRVGIKLFAEPLGWGTNYFKRLLEADGYVLIEGDDLKEGMEVVVYLIDS